MDSWASTFALYSTVKLIKKTLFRGAREDGSVWVFTVLHTQLEIAALIKSTVNVYGDGVENKPTLTGRFPI